MLGSSLHFSEKKSFISCLKHLSIVFIIHKYPGVRYWGINQIDQESSREMTSRPLLYLPGSKKLPVSLTLPSLPVAIPLLVPPYLFLASLSRPFRFSTASSSQLVMDLTLLFKFNITVLYPNILQLLFPFMIFLKIKKSFGYKFLIKHTICKYFLPVYSFDFHSPTLWFKKQKFNHFWVIQCINVFCCRL